MPVKDSDDAAEDLGLAPKTLANWRYQGRGPRYLKLGQRVVYEQAELDAFKAANTRRSTSDRPPPPDMFHRPEKNEPRTRRARAGAHKDFKRDHSTPIGRRVRQPRT